MAIKMACPNCDRSYNLADTMAGKTIRCKDCEKTFEVEEDDNRILIDDDVRRKRSSVSAPRSSRNGDLDDDDMPRKKRKSKGVPVGLIIGGGVGLLVVIIGVILLVVLLNGNKLTSENVAKVKVGMTEQEVIGLVGSPTETQSAGPLGKSMSWSNNKDLGLAVVFNSEGKADMVMPLDLSKVLDGNPFAGNNLPNFPNPGIPNPGIPNFPNPGLPNPGIPNPGIPNPGLPNPNGQVDPRLTHENVHKVRKGMAEQQILALLGNPQKTDEPAKHFAPEFAKDWAGKKTLSYHDNLPGGILIEIGLLNGKADSITGLSRNSADFPNFNQGSTPGPGPIVGPGPRPNPGPGPVVGQKPAGIDPTRLQGKMTEQQITVQYGQPTKSVDVDAQTANKLVAPQHLKRPDGSFKPVKALYYPKSPAPGQVELLFVEGLLYDCKVGPATDPMSPPVNPNENPNPNPQGSIANAGQVQKGMSEKEVTDLLGRPAGSAQKTVRQGGITTVIRTLTFNEGAGKPSVTVVLINGKVDHVLK